MKTLDWLLLAALAATVFFAARRLWRTRKQGGCCGCSGCASCASCGEKSAGPGCSSGKTAAAGRAAEEGKQEEANRT